MDRTEATICKLLAALRAPGYDLGILSDSRMYRLEAVQASRLVRVLRYLKYRNANGAHIYIRPTGESAYTLLDDLSPATLDRLEAEGYAPAAVIETSPGNFQAWLRHSQPLPKEFGTLAAVALAEQFSADRSAADWRRFGRAPDSRTASRSTATPKACIPSSGLSATVAKFSPSPNRSACNWSFSSSKPNRNAPLCV